MFSQKVVDLLTATHGSADVLLTTSCTSALEMSALLLDLEPGDTVIVPSFTFVSSALAFVRTGARVVFADIESDTLGIDPNHVSELLDDSVRAVVAVHYAGIGCDIAGLQSAIADDQRVALVEDNAHGLFGTYQGMPLGSFGRFSTLSFHETKNFVCGEGGALVVNRNNDVGRAHVLHAKGTNRQAFMLGLVDKYSWVGTARRSGSRTFSPVTSWASSNAERRSLPSANGARHVPAASRTRGGPARYTAPRRAKGSDAGYHVYYVILPDAVSRDRVLASMTRTVSRRPYYARRTLRPADSALRPASPSARCRTTSHRASSGSRSTTRSTPARSNTSSRPLSKRSIMIRA